MFDKILIANRGAIATRIIRTISAMGCRSVVVYNEADADSLHVQMADEAFSLGSGRAADTYLDQDKLFDVIDRSGAQAVHPGYGFLSENPDFVSRCDEHGVAFIGPAREHIEAFGLKHTARRIATENNVPLLPGTGLLDTLENAVEAADEIGYPVMLKSTAGGGGIGMQLCWTREELRDSFDSVRSLSESNFSSGGLFLEKFIEQARHIEVQVFGDGCGNAVAIGERDCSIQRRNQKVIEECPAPNIPDAVRNVLRETAVRLAGAVGYRSAGTVEYVYDQNTDDFYFLEVNTRLQVEHGVTEEVYGVDLVEWMVRLAAGELGDLQAQAKLLQPHGHAVQARVYAEDPNKGFQPSAGLLTEVEFPERDEIRIDHWLVSGLDISALFDPMLAKVIATADDRDTAIERLDSALSATRLYGVETNIDYVRQVLGTEIFRRGESYTRYLDSFEASFDTVDVLTGGTQTTLQDYPSRQGYWDVGVPPSGPFDSLSFRLANRLLGNDERAVGLEITLNGPSLRFNTDTRFVLAGASMVASVDDVPVEMWRVVDVSAGQTLSIGSCADHGARSYLCISGGFDCPQYLGSRSTFTLGQFGGHAGRALRSGDVLHVGERSGSPVNSHLRDELVPDIGNHWMVRVIYGPHGAPDFFTPRDIDTFFEADWKVHYNSSRTGIRLVGPRPEWARSSGGEAGMHPSNIHDNAYAVGAVDYTGDMPVILGPDGPSLGGFVCPATVISADLWKLGQLKAGDTLRFVPVTIEAAVALEKAQLDSIARLEQVEVAAQETEVVSPVYKTVDDDVCGIKVVYRPSGDKYLLIEFGAMVLDIALRFRVHALMLWLQQQGVPGLREMTPGIRSLQIHYQSQEISLAELVSIVDTGLEALQDIDDLEVPARIIKLPLSWDDSACRLAIEKYMMSVRKDAPWCPSNLEFIRRINGLESIDQVKDIVFNASYLVMGLGDVYLGAPVATPLDPRHRLVTTKYNPARTWTAENSVGIGGSYLCVYGMEGPGGYQFVGRTLQMWNRHRQTEFFVKPWLLRFFDQIQFYEVSDEELQSIRHDFPKGRYPIDIEETSFSLRRYRNFLEENDTDIRRFTEMRQEAFDQELQRWVESGQIAYDSDHVDIHQPEDEEELPDGCIAIHSPVAANVWKVMVEPGDRIEKEQKVAILESMKMEIHIESTHAGEVISITRGEGSQVDVGQTLLVVQKDDS